MSDDRILARHPDPARQGTRIARRLYDPVRTAILETLAEGEVAFGDLRAAIAERTDPAMWEEHSLGWYTTTVKLDLEARGEIQRVPGVSPQRLRLVG